MWARSGDSVYPSVTEDDLLLKGIQRSDTSGLFQITWSYSTQKQEIKGTAIPLHVMGGAWGERRYSSYILTSTLEGGGE
jgi:hypothetical protein